VQQTVYSEKVTEYAKTYSAMKPAQAASIFNTMTNNLELVAEILQNMNATSRGSILGAMDTTVAAKVTGLMAPKNN
jgi:flagellar motility protein MotE (MotC chaperone)